MSWTEERITKLKSMWGHGYSASQIARELGGGVTRNAVIGKAHRLNLATTKIVKTRATSSQPRIAGMGRVMNMPRKTMMRAMPGMPAAPAKITRNVVQPVNPQYRDPEFRPATAVAPVDLKEGQCRWPLGDPRSPDFKYCGCKSHEGLPYCADHARMAYHNFGRTRQRPEGLGLPTIAAPVSLGMTDSPAV